MITFEQMMIILKNSKYEEKHLDLDMQIYYMEWSFASKDLTMHWKYT